MKNKFFMVFMFLLVLSVGITTGILMRHNDLTWAQFQKTYQKYFSEKNEWSEDFDLVELKSSIDSNIQKIYCFKSRSRTPQPLIVSLHTWGGDYSQKDDLAVICKQKNLNYIHPDFRGPNRTIMGCCSELALADLDDAITYAIENFNVNKSKIYVIGVSGGGYATLSTFMKSKHNIKKFSAWSPVTDLLARYNESKIQNNTIFKDILMCTNSDSILNIEKAKKKSPIYWKTPIEKLKKSKVLIYTGVFDGIQGSVPITHSINFYNKLLSDLSVSDSTKYVSNSEKLNLLEYRKPLGDYGNIESRKIYLEKKFENVSLVIFEGGHEMLTDYAIHNLVKEN